jgi:glycosyltransferase involved in cell wall biosynthesis
MSQRPRLSIWSPLPPSPSGIADYVAESLPLLALHFELQVVVENENEQRQSAPPGVRVCGPSEAAEDALDVYHVGNSPAHGYVYRAAVARPGLVFLHEWNLHHLILSETVERGDVPAYLREMRRTYGERGSFVGLQISRALGGHMLPALYPLNRRLLDSALAVVGLTDAVCSRAQRQLGGRPVFRLPHHLALPCAPPPEKRAARQALGLPEEAWIVTAPGLATAAKRLPVALRAFARVRHNTPQSLFIVAGGEEADLGLDAIADDLRLGPSLRRTGRLPIEDFIRHLAAADVILALRFPSYGEISGALIRALGLGRPALVTAGTPAADEFPQDVVLSVDPGVREEEHLASLLTLLQDAAVGRRLGENARAFIMARHDLSQTVEQLASFLIHVHKEKAALGRSLESRRSPEGSLAEYLDDEIQRHLGELGLTGISFSSLLADLSDQE